MKATKIEVGDYVNICKSVEFYGGDWGIVTMIDADGWYHVAMFGDANSSPVFLRREIRLYKKGV